MDEKLQKEAKEEKPADSKEDSTEGGKYETTPIIERARQEREAMEKATEAQRFENDRREKLQSQAILGGEIDAGATKEAPKEDTPKEYADKVMSGELNPETEDAS